MSTSIKPAAPKSRLSARLDALDSLSPADLLPLLDSPDEAVAGRACWLLAATKQKRYIPALLKIIRSEREALWQPAANGLSHLDSNRSVRPLLLLLLDSSRAAGQRAAAAYALAFSWNALADRQYADPISDAFLSILGDRMVPAEVRGQVAEGLAYLHGACVGARDRRRTAYRKAGDLLIDCLSDPAPQVRFWAAFALGSMRYRQALPALRKLAGKDRGHFGSWWTVGAEASDSISLLEGRQPPIRTQKFRSP